MPKEREPAIRCSALAQIPWPMSRRPGTVRRWTAFHLALIRREFSRSDQQARPITIMDNVVHLLGNSEHAVLRAFRNLAQFRQSYDLQALQPVKGEFGDLFGAAANSVLSQAIVLDRVLMKSGLDQDWHAPSDPRASAAELRLLELIRCGQQSIFELDRLVTEQFMSRRSDIVSMVCRYASMLLLAGLVLPPRGRETSGDRMRRGGRKLIAIGGERAQPLAL